MFPRPTPEGHDATRAAASAAHSIGCDISDEPSEGGAAQPYRNHSYRETDWSEFNTLVEKLMASYDLPAAAKPSDKIVAQ